MAQKTIYYCDGCGAEKREVNHWFGAWLGDRGCWVVQQFDRADLDLAKIYCGQQCVTKALSEYMAQCAGKVQV